MKINRRLNLAFTVEREDGSIIHVHHVPISEEIFDANWRVLTKAVTSMYSDVYMPLVAARIGYRMIRDVATFMKMDMDALELGFFSHVWRLTTLILPERPDPVPLDVAFASNLLDSEELSEVRNCICFFTAASWVHPRNELAGMYQLLAGENNTSGKLTGSWSVMEYAISLRTSKPAENTGAKETVASIPH